MAMLAVELLTGMQVYVGQTVLPLMATELNARDSYGLVTAAAQVPAFLTMPLGGAMLGRWRADRLMTALTAVLVAGAGACALAPTVWVYVLGEAVRGLGAGALATVGMGVLVAGLPGSWRRLFLSAGSAMWVLSALLGPTYAAGVSAGWGWRWALVGYLPLLVAARVAAARAIRDLRVRADEEGAPLIPAVALATGVALVGAFSASSYRFWVASALGGALVLWACARVLPAGVVRAARGRPAALAALAWVCGAYFSLDYLVSPAAHDVLGLAPGAIGWALTGEGLAWSAVAMWCGAHPAPTPAAYRRRTTAGAALFGVGGCVMACALGGALPWWGLHAGWMLAGIGMGWTHQDTLARCVADPAETGLPVDGISQARIAASVTVGGAVGGATLGTFATSVVAPGADGVQAALVVPTVLALAAALAAAPLLTRRVG